MLFDSSSERRLCTVLKKDSCVVGLADGADDAVEGRMGLVVLAIGTLALTLALLWLLPGACSAEGCSCCCPCCC